MLYKVVVRVILRAGANMSDHRKMRRFSLGRHYREAGETTGCRADQDGLYKVGLRLVAMGLLRRNLLQAEQQRVESEQAARQLAWEAALKAEKASGRVETAVEEVRELSLDCRAAEAVSKRLQAELNELREKDSKDSQHAELSEDLVAAVRLAVQRHKATSFDSPRFASSRCSWRRRRRTVLRCRARWPSALRDSRTCPA